MAKEKAKVRNRPDPVFDSKNSKVKDNKDHFPLGSESQARNAIARVNQYDSVPDWYDGSLKSLQDAVIRAVKKKYPDIEISDKAKKTKKEEKDKNESKDRCWKGYEPAPGKKPYSPGSCKKASLNQIFRDLLILKTDNPQVYKAAVSSLKSKVASGEPHHGFSPQQIEEILSYLD